MYRYPESPTENEPLWKWLTGGWAISGAVLIVLVIAFYVEEDWRGEAYWKQAQEEIAAKGESLDPKAFIPAPVPVEENFGLQPIFQMAVSTTVRTGYLSPVGMDRAFAHVSPNEIPTSSADHLSATQLPYLGSWAKGEQTDVPAIHTRLADLCHRDLSAAPVLPNASLTDMFGLLCPVLAQLRAANATHPQCRFDCDYRSVPAYRRPMGAITSPIQLAKVLSYEERLALLDNQPQLALDDLKVGWKVDSGLRQEPILLAGLVSGGVVAIQLGLVSEGLGKHVWNDQQLASLDADLDKIDYLKESQFCIRGDTAVFSIPNTDFLKEHRLEIRNAMFGPMSSPSPYIDIQYFLFSTLVLLIPDGWFDDCKADEARFNLLGTVTMVDPALRRVYPENERRAVRLIDDARETAYWRDYMSRMFESTLHSASRFAYAQVQVDEARIACRLERYRLSQGRYPSALGDLTPSYGADLPNDVMNGQPYHYKLLGDGTYLLYSVGWDQVDDGGKVNISSTGYHYYRNDPDWVWSNHQEAPKKSK